MTHILAENATEIVEVREVPVGVRLTLDQRVAHKTVKEKDLRRALGVSRVQYHGYDITVTLPEGERWNDEYEPRFRSALAEVFGHQFEFATMDLLIY